MLPRSPLGCITPFLETDDLAYQNHLFLGRLIRPPPPRPHGISHLRSRVRVGFWAAPEGLAELFPSRLVPDFEAHKPPKGAYTADAVYSCRTGKPKPTLGPLSGCPKGFVESRKLGFSDRQGEELECS